MILSERELPADTSQDPFGAVMKVATRPPVVFVAGEGSWLRDASGRVYLDFIQGWAVNSLGHCPPAITAAMARQAALLLNCSPPSTTRR
jgi:acetylornithine/N-succinyldiaminopimelate aminotransferase